MSVSLDQATEDRIEREMARGIYREPAEVVSRALDLLESQEEWLQRNQGGLTALLEERWAEAERGDFLSEQELQDFLARGKQKVLSRAG